MQFKILFSIGLIGWLNLSPLHAQTEQERPWYIPTHGKLQFAGNIGMFSLGTGYHLKNPKWEIDLMYGYVPAKYADDPIHSLTIKTSWGTFKRSYHEDIDITWLKIGLFQNYSFGQKYFSRLPEYYDKGYYYFSTALNFGLFYGAEIKYKNAALYTELGTSDKHLINYVKNPYSVNFNELWNIGIGVKYYLK